MSHPSATLDFAVEAARLLADRHCENVRLLDVRGLSQVCDYVLIGTGTSDRQMKSLAGELEDLGADRSNRVFRSNRDEGGTWIVVDFVNLVTHLFEPHMRAYYDLETLWADARVVDWQRSGPTPNGPAFGRRAAPDKTARRPHDDIEHE
jgi:ribosome-associated protein